MNLIDAWNVLGTDPESVFNFIRIGKTPGEKVKRAEEKLEEARSIAKKLMGTHHPDRNQTDSEAAVRFRRVSEALSVIENSTTEMKQKAESFPEISKKRGPIIVVG
ncbi:MAG: hypothetical protein WC708_00505 [Lentisphaeria bacterium]